MGTSLTQQQRRGKGDKGSDAAERVVVAVRAAKEIPRTALVWALTHVVQPGDCLTLLVVIPTHSSGRKLWGFPLFAGDCASGHRRLHSGSTMEQKADITDLCSQMMLQLRDVYDPDKINIKVKITSGSPCGAVAAESKRAQASWVVLDKQLKNEEKHCLDELQHCSIVAMKRSQPKVLRLNLGGSPEPEPQLACPLPSELDKSTGGNTKDTRDSRSSIRAPAVTPTSSPEVDTPFSATEAGTSSVSSSDPGTSPLSISETKEGFKKEEQVAMIKNENLNVTSSDSDSGSLSPSAALEFEPWVAEILSGSHRSSKQVEDLSQRFEDRIHVSQTNVLKEKFCKLDPEVGISTLNYRQDPGFGGNVREARISTLNYRPDSDSSRLNYRPDSDSSRKFKEAKINTLNYRSDSDFSRGVREAISLSRSVPPGPPPLCSICQHKAPESGKPPRAFSYSELELATGGFSQANFLAEGGYGSVHRGILPDGQAVAVKQHKLASSQGDHEFCSEVDVLSCAQHRNVVMLIGYCTENNRRLLVYEYICNGSLHSHLYGCNKPLEWYARQKIAAGAARGLRYLHDDCRVGCIVHRDMRPHNILLTHDFKPLVGDFGLARWQPDGDLGEETRVIGTIGYVAPEYSQTGQITEKADVYSFGVVLVELITGRKAMDISRPKGQQLLTEWARPLLEEHVIDELIDPRLGNCYSEHEVLRMIYVASLCIRRDPHARPRMCQVVQILDDDLVMEPSYMTTPSCNAGSRSGRICVDQRQHQKTLTTRTAANFGRKHSYGGLIASPERVGRSAR